MPLLTDHEIGSYYDGHLFSYPRSVRHQFHGGTHYLHLFEHLTMNDIQYIEHGAVEVDCVATGQVAFLAARLLPDSLAVYLPLDPVIGCCADDPHKLRQRLDVTGVCARTGLVVARRRLTLDDTYLRAYRAAWQVYDGRVPTPEEFERRVQQAESSLLHITAHVA